MKRRIDFTRENRPFFYYQRVKILHSVESVLFKIDARYNFLLRAVMEKHNGYAALCPESEAFLPGAVNIGADEITLVSTWPVGKAVTFLSDNALPTPLVAGTVYYVRTNVAGVITLSASYGGAVFNLTGAGVGNHTIYAALCPDIGFQIQRVSSGEGVFYAPVSIAHFGTPGPVGVGVQTESAPYNTDAYGVNFSATPRKLAAPLDDLYISGEAIQILITGQTVNSVTAAEDNLPSYVDLMLTGRHYPDASLPQNRGR